MSFIPGRFYSIQRYRADRTKSRYTRATRGVAYFALSRLSILRMPDEAFAVNIELSFFFDLPWNRRWPLEDLHLNNPSWLLWRRAPCSCSPLRIPWETERRTRCRRTSTRQLPLRMRPAAEIAETACFALLKHDVWSYIMILLHFYDYLFGVSEI